MGKPPTLNRGSQIGPASGAQASTSLARMNRRLRLARIVALLLVIGLTVYIYSIREQAESLAQYGFAGIFLLSLLSYATILLPAPGLAIVFAMGGVFPPAGLALAAAAGAALGELSGYLAGFSGQAIVERGNRYERLQGWMKRNGPATIFVLALIPNPLFDLAGVTAGALRMPVLRFLLWTFLGQAVKMTVFAYAGATSIGALLEFIPP